MKKPYRILLGVVLGLIVLIVSAQFFANWWIEKRLPALINEKNKSDYYITYKHLDISLWRRSIEVKGVIVLPKSAVADTSDQAGIFVKIPSVSLNDFSISSALFSDRIKAGSLTLLKPELTLYRGHKTHKKARTVKDDVVRPFDKVISVSELIVKQANARIVDAKTQKTVLAAHNVSVSVNGIVVDSAQLKRKIPFSFKDYAVTMDSVFYKAKGFYEVAAGEIACTNSSLMVKDLSYLCKTDRGTFDASLKTERDMYNIRLSKLMLSGLEWTLTQDERLSVKGKNLVIEKARANIYRNKTIADDLRKKKLYSQLLRELKFDLDLEKLMIRNSTLEYEEKISDRGPGKLRFSPFHLTAKNIRSAHGRPKIPDVNISINARFMDVSPLVANWSFNANDRTDGFRIKGSITKFPVERLHQFLKPYLNFEGEGELQKVIFDYKGNDNGAHGKFAIEYDHLKLEAFRKKNPEKKNKVLTAVANLLVKKDSNDKLKHAQVSVEREKDKSFYNLFWKCMQHGLEQTLLVI